MFFCFKKLVNYLNDPLLVAQFQKYFDIIALSPNDIKKNKEKNNLSQKLVSNEQIKFNSVSHILSSSSKSKHSAFSNSPLKTVNYKVNNKFWFYLFSFGASLGYEHFYAIFFPFIFWNFDQALGRKVMTIWVFLMYIGQCLKDLIKSPRPSSPPVVTLEPKYAIEYGMPSTHAMIGAGIPFSLIIFTLDRFEYSFWLGVMFAIVWCLLVCLSRLYLGMHSVLDVIVGLKFAIFLIIIFASFVESLDEFCLTNKYSPLVSILVILTMARIYPKPDIWSPARGDTCIVMGAGLGVNLGSWLTYHSGFVKKRFATPPFPITCPDFYSLFFVLLTTVIGTLILVLTRTLAKSVIYTCLCHIYKLNLKDEKTKRNALVEVPYKLLTYTIIGLSITYLSPMIFRYLNIERAPLYL